MESLIREWLAVYDDYLRRERRETLEQEPSPEKLAAFKSELRLLLRSARALQAFVADPDFPSADSAAEVGGKVLQLQTSWEMLNNAMTLSEADAFVAAHFRE